MNAFGRLVTTCVVLALMGGITPTSLVFAQSDRPQVYLAKGFVSSSSPDGLEYETAIEGLRTAYPGVDFHIYDHAGNNEETSTTIFQDVAAHPTAEKYGVFYSYSVGLLGSLDTQGVKFQFVTTLDGYDLHGPISLDLHNVSSLFNILTDQGVIHGAAHTLGPGDQYRELTLSNTSHQDLLGVFTGHVDGLGWVARRAARGAGPGSVGGAGGGGVESRPLWLERRGMWRYSESSGAVAYQVLLSSTGLLAQFVPPQGPRGEPGQSVIPKNVVGNSNATDALGMDYVGVTTGQVVASIFGAETLNSVYEHDYVVCSRVQNYELQTVLPFRYNLHWWWMARATKANSGCDELVVPLTIRLSGSQAVIDSRYVVENYPSSITGTVLNYQIRARDLPDAIFFLDSILTALAQGYTVSFANLSEPPQPTVFARTATYRSPNIHLVVDNQGTPCSVRFSGPTWAEPRAQAEKLVEFNLTVPSGVSEVDLPVGPIHDAVIYIESGGFMDKVYVASGYWFAWDDRASGGTSSVSLVTGELQHPAIPGTDTSFVSPPLAEMTGVVTAVLSWSHVGMGYTFQQGAEPVNLSACNGLLFYAHGDGKQYRVKLESTAVKDNDYHGVYFVAEPEWKLITVPFSELAQEGWGQHVPWTGTDVRTISFVTVGRPHPSIHLAIDRISFRAIGGAPLLHDWNDDGIVSIIGDVPPFVNCVYFSNCPGGVDPAAVGDCNHDGIISIIGDVPCFVNCVYFANCPE